MTTAPSSNMPLIADKPRSNKIGSYVVFLTLKPLKVMLNISKVKSQDLEFMCSGLSTGMSTPIQNAKLTRLLEAMFCIRSIPYLFNVFFVTVFSNLHSSNAGS
jgi:hypothetical protein